MAAGGDEDMQVMVIKRRVDGLLHRGNIMVLHFVLCPCNAQSSVKERRQIICMP